MDPILPIIIILVVFYAGYCCGIIKVFNRIKDALNDYGKSDFRKIEDLKAIVDHQMMRRKRD